MLTTMVAGPSPTAYCENSGGRQPPSSPRMGHQRSCSSPAEANPLPNDSSTLYTSSLNSSNSSITSSPSTLCPSAINNGPMGAIVMADGMQPDPHQQYTTPPLSGPMSHPQGPPPPYCPQEYIPGDPYYPGPPPEYCQHHPMCNIHGVPGPATVRMVSTNSSPPIPLPVQMPPGHVVQQIVDESGTLQHVILSAQPMTLPVCSYGPNGGQGPPQFYSPPPGPPPPQGYMTSYQPGPQYPPVMSPPLTQQQPSPPPPHNYVKNDRNSRQQEKLRNKFYQRHPPLAQHQHQQQQYPPHHHQHYTSHHPPLHLKHHSNNMQNAPPLSPKKEVSLHHKMDGGVEPVNGEMEEGVPVPLQDILSQIPDPDVCEIGPYSAKFLWVPPDLSLLSLRGLSESNLCYEVFLNNSLYDTVHDNQLSLTNLRPGTEYKLYLVCMCNGVRGYPTPKKAFCTKPTIPDDPLPPRVVDRKKNSLLIRWVPPKENGAKIQHFSLEMVGGHLDRWTEVYRNRGREYAISKLKPQTSYKFRITATNLVGTSNNSPELIVVTSGLAPTQPQPPGLVSNTITSLKLGWEPRPCDDVFSLEMDDPANEYGFRPVYDGEDVSYACRNLRRNSRYKFRLSSRNANGKSPFSDIASYQTLPDAPKPPGNLALKGKPHADKFHIAWAPPPDDGGTPVSSYTVQIKRRDDFETIYTGPKLDCEATGLSPGKEYPVRCLSEGPGGTSHWSQEAYMSTKAVIPGYCKPPRLFGKPKAHCLSLRWDYPELDGGCSVNEFHVDMITPDTDRRRVYLGQDTECTVASLLPGRAYMFLLQAVNKVGAGPWSEPFEVVSGPGIPDTPKAPHVACKGPHVVLVSWEEPINNGARIDQYNVQYAETCCPNAESSESSSTSGDPDSELTFTTIFTGAAPSAEVRNLTPASMYAFRLCASNVAGIGAYSPVSMVTTPAASPAPVTHITSSIEATEVSLHWSEPRAHGDPITHYRIEYGDQGVTTEGPVLEFTVSGLLPVTTYRFRIQAVNSVGSSPLSGPHKVTTRPLPPHPPTIELVKASFNSLRLKWGEGRNPYMLKYSLQMECHNPHNNTMEFYQIYGGMNQAFKVGRLDENTTYRFQISACNEAGLGQDSTPVEFVTTKAPPPPLKAPRISETDNGYYSVEWCSVRCPCEADHIVYRLQILQSGKDLDYSLIYKGDSTKFMLSKLSPQSGYYVRVCGVRMSGETEVVAGSYSSPTLFNTRKAPEESAGPGADKKAAHKEKPFNWRELTDHQKAFAILAIFSLLAFVAAYVMSPDGGR